MAKALVEDEQAVLQAEGRSYSGGAKTGTASNALLAPDRRAATYAAFKAAPRFVLLDFRCGGPHARIASDQHRVY